MKKIILTGMVMTCISVMAYSNTIIVDINGGGDFTSIQTAITNASTNDTVKVWPGTYFEQVTLNKNIVLMGSGYENTIITGNYDPTIVINIGKMMWFGVSSTLGNGIKILGGIVTNCLVQGCPKNGIYSKDNGVATIINCVLYSNGQRGIISSQSCNLTVINCIAWNNGSGGFLGQVNYGGYMYLSYSNGQKSETYGNQGCINTDPFFFGANDFHISQGSPSENTGNPTLSDPDGTISDMGYFGGPDCPIYPTVFEIIITPNGDNINLEAKGRANY